MINNELEKIKEKINKADVVSFDIFDTLVFRNVLYPVDIFRLMESLIYEKYGLKGFSKIRTESEAKTRLIANKEDITLDEIYSTITKKLGSTANKIKELELELEDKFIIMNPFMKEVFDYAIESKKTIYVISDMYLSSEFLVNKLEALGYIRI